MSATDTLRGPSRVIYQGMSFPLGVHLRAEEIKGIERTSILARLGFPSTVKLRGAYREDCPSVDKIYLYRHDGGCCVTNLRGYNGGRIECDECNNGISTSV